MSIQKIIDDTPEWSLLDFDGRDHDPRNTYRGYGLTLGDREEVREGRVWQVREGEKDVQ